MRLLLRNLETGHYYAGLDVWTHDPKKALDLQSTERATAVFDRDGLVFAEIVLFKEERKEPRSRRSRSRAPLALGDLVPSA
jgi:hypothetical protein